MPNLLVTYLTKQTCLSSVLQIVQCTRSFVFNYYYFFFTGEIKKQQHLTLHHFIRRIRRLALFFCCPHLKIFSQISSVTHLISRWPYGFIYNTHWKKYRQIIWALVEKFSVVFKYTQKQTPSKRYVKFKHFYCISHYEIYEYITNISAVAHCVYHCLFTARRC